MSRADSAPSVEPFFKSNVLVLLAIGIAMTVAQGAVTIDHRDVESFVVSALIHGAIYLIGVWWVLSRPTSLRELAVILVVALCLRGLAMTALPYLTTDAFRYVWDGRIQLEGYSPYAFAPADPSLAHFRDDQIYPYINQKEVAVSIYPPLAEMIFMATAGLHDGIAGLKLTMFLFEAVTIGALLGWLKAERLPASRVLIYAWHPLPIWEFTSQAHIDAAATAFLSLGILAAVHRRQGLTGALFACAAMVKYFPLVLLPALWRRWDWRLPTALIVTAGLLFIPYAARGDMFGFLGTHLGNEGYRDGWGFQIVWFLRDFSIADPGPLAYLLFAGGVLVLLAIWAVFARGRDEFLPNRMALLGAAFLFLTSPHYPWYFAFLCALCVRTPHPALLAMTLGCLTLYLPRPPGGLTWTELYAVTYLLPLLIWIGVEIWRAFRITRRSVRHRGNRALKL